MLGVYFVGWITANYIAAAAYFGWRKEWPWCLMYTGFALGNIGPMWAMLK